MKRSFLPRFSPKDMTPNLRSSWRDEQVMHTIKAEWIVVVSATLGINTRYACRGSVSAMHRPTQPPVLYG
jgi:hypothetical protein